ncbi:MAG: FtsW/RodA/SpoVE family cell cycle protein [Endomicrobiia bacterium]
MKYKFSFDTQSYKDYADILFFSTLGLSIFGCVMIFSVTSHINNFIFLKKQILAIIIGILLCGLVYNLDLNLFKKLTYPLTFFGFILLISVFFFPAKNGAHRWINIPFFGNFQPSELIKVILVLFVAKYVDLYRSKIINYSRPLWILMITMFIFCFLIMLQPDIGTPLLIITVLILTLFVSSITLKKNVVFKILIGLIFILILGFFSKPYRIARLKAMLNPWQYKSTVGYQLVQSYLSLARGHFSGCGLGNGIFKEYYLPEAHTDFIFCMIGEELGFIGTTGIIFVYTLICFLGLSIAYRCCVNFKNFYGGLIVFGLTLNIVLQAYISIAMTIGLLPTKGMGLPFVSYGGSSIIVNFLSIGLILNIWRRCYK